VSRADRDRSPTKASRMRAAGRSLVRQPGSPSSNASTAGSRHRPRVVTREDDHGVAGSSLERAPSVRRASAGSAGGPSPVRVVRAPVPAGGAWPTRLATRPPTSTASIVTRPPAAVLRSRADPNGCASDRTGRWASTPTSCHAARRTVPAARGRDRSPAVRVELR
jgi:hypothetical protein